MERKTFPGFVTKADADKGIVKAVFALFGNIDQANDIVHPGAFVKTFHEHGLKVRVLDAHRTDSIMRVLGKPLSLREVGRDELPDALKTQYPTVTGGAEAEIQFLMDTPEGKGAFIRLKEGAVDEWSWGYDALDADNSRVMKDGQEVLVRNLRTVKLYEVSPVLFGCNPATTTLSAKDAKPAPDVTENTIRIRVRDPDDFQEDSFRTIAIGDKDQGIQATIGKLKGEDSTTVQAYVFDKEKWTPAKAQSWVDDHGKDFDPEAAEKALTEDDAPEIVPDEEGESYTCECIECGHVMTSTEHCRDLKCPKCGGQMRRAERPGPGQSSLDVEGEQKDEDAEDETPGKSASAPAETKYGRAISGRNAEQMINAIVTIANILESAGYDIPGYDKQPKPINPSEQDEEGKSVPLALLYKEITEQGPTVRLRNALEAAIHKVFTVAADNLHLEGYLSREERIALSGAIGDALTTFGEAIPEELAQRVITPYAVMEATSKSAETATDAPVTDEPQDASQDQQDEKRAGPSDEAPTPDEGAGPPEGETPTQQVDPKLALIRISQAQLDLLEV